MKRPVLAALLGALTLSACASGGADVPQGSERPNLPTGVEVRFPAAPANAYLSLQNDAGQSVYQIGVEQGKTSAAVDPDKWAAQSAAAKDLSTLLPEASATIDPSGVKAVLLHWVMWQDANQNGKQDEGEALDLMTHDRVAYASAAVRVEVQGATMHELWKLKAGWSRAEHYVYLPKGKTVYERRFESNGLQRYELHLPTPVTSQ